MASTWQVQRVRPAVIGFFGRGGLLVLACGLLSCFGGVTANGQSVTTGTAQFAQYKTKQPRVANSVVVEQATAGGVRSGVLVDDSYLLSGVDVVAGDHVTTGLLDDGRGVEVGVDEASVSSAVLERVGVLDDNPFVWDRTSGADIGTTGGVFTAPAGLKFTADQATSAAYTFERGTPPLENPPLVATMHIAGVPEGHGSVQSIQMVNFGSGYESTPTVTLVGGGGSGATAVAVLGAGVFPNATITDGGYYDDDDDNVTAYLDPPLPGDAVTVFTDSGEVVGLSISSTPRDVLPTIIFSEPTITDGRKAVAIAEFEGGFEYVARVVITDAGSGYTSPPDVVIAGNATAIATVSVPDKSATLVVDQPDGGASDVCAAWLRGDVDVDGDVVVFGDTSFSGGVSAGGTIAANGGVSATTITATSGSTLWGNTKVGIDGFGEAMSVGYPWPAFPSASNVSINVKDSIRAGDDLHARDGIYAGDPGNNIYGLGAHGGHLRTYGNLEVNPNNPVREGAQGRVFLTTTANTTDTKFQLYTATDGLHIDRGGSESKTGTHDINLDENVKVTGNVTATGDVTVGDSIVADGAVTAHNGTVATVLSGVSFVNPARSDELANHTTETSFKVAGTTTPLSITFPANTLAVGQLYRVTAAGGFACASNGTLSLNLRLAGALMVNGGLALTAGAASSWMIQGDLYVESIGASGKLQLSNCQHGMRTTFQMPVPWEFTVNTTADIVITSNATWTVANAGNNSRLWRLTLERLR